MPLNRLAALDALHARYDGPVPRRARAGLDGPARDRTLDRLMLRAVTALARLRRRAEAPAVLARVATHVAACRAIAVGE